MLIGFRNSVFPEPLLPVERMCHRRNTGGIHGLKLINQLDDVRELRLDIRHFVDRDFESGQNTEFLDVFSVE